MKQTAMRISDDLIEKLRIIASKRQSDGKKVISIASLLREAVEKFIQEEEGK